MSPPIPGVVHRLIGNSVGVTLVPESDGGPYMANLGHGKYFTRSGSSFRQMEHYQVIDTLNRRRQPELSVCAVMSSNGNAITVSILNTGRVSAKAPYLELNTRGPWVLAPGVDGNRNWNLPKIVHSGPPDSSQPRFGGGLTTVIHPQTRLDVCVLNWIGAETAKLPLVEIGYAFAAEDVPLNAGTLFVPRNAGVKVSS